MKTPRSLRTNALATAVALATLGSTALTHAQSGVLEEVIVVATKREQTLQEVPVAVSVVSAETIEQAQVLDIKDLQTLVPSLRVSQLQTSANTNFIIRGFGNGANNAGIEPSVGVFVDGVYRSRVGSSLADLPKLERVEVLRGPQSTLFGKNASAGVINVVTAKPDLDEYSGSVGATVGNYNQLIFRGDATGPITDELAFSVFASSNERDGYFDNRELGTSLNELDRWNFRGQLFWVPTDAFEARLIVDAENIDEACCGVANLVDGPTGDIVRALGGELVPNDAFAYEGFFDFDPVNEIDTQGTSLHLNYDFDAVSLTSITAYRTLESFANSDIDFTSARLFDPVAGNSTEQNIDTFTQEFRLTSNSDGPLNWMVGAFYFDEDVEQNASVLYGDQFRAYADALSAGGVSAVEAALGPVLGIPAGTFFAPGTGFVSENYTLEDETLSLFAQGDYNLTDTLVLTLGVNYTESDKVVATDVVNNDVFSSLPLDAFLPPEQAIPLQALQFLPPFVDIPNAVEGNETNDSDTTWTVRLAYDVNANINVYAGASTGFKASSWNLSRDSRPLAEDIPGLIAAGLAVPNLTAGTRFAGPEESLVYELGLKASYDAVAFNLTLFTQEIEGFQSNVFNGTGFNLANAGKQSTDGVEFDINYAVTEGLRLAFAATWLDPIYDDFTAGNGVDGPTDLTGTTPAGISEWSTNTSGTYRFAIAGIASYVRVEHVYESEVQAIENVPEEVASREVNTINASAGMTFSNGIDLNLWGRNLSNDEYIQQAFPGVAQPGTFSGYPNTPRTYGLTARYSF